ncbi:hypothetical protein [uncultured Cardiobacterium sp.]|nr:hypothetical protein [uncultured Cardiobacterium sp.]
MTPADFLATRLEPAAAGDAYAACQANPVNETGHLQANQRKERHHVR